MSRILFGYPTVTITEATQEYMALAGNFRQQHFVSLMVSAKRAWKDLMKNTVWTVRQKFLEVSNCDTVELPKDVLRLLNLSIVDDCGNQRPLSYDRNMNTLQLLAPKKKCSCKACDGNGTLCDAMDYIQLRTQEMTIKNQVYLKRIWNRKCEDGSLMEVTETPVYIPNEAPDLPGTIEWIRDEHFLCNLEVNECGCIKSTPQNKELIEKHCGCFHMHLQRKKCEVAVPSYSNHFGHWKEDAENNRLIHLRGLKAKMLIVGYQPVLDHLNIGDMMIPDYALDAFTFGLDYYTKVFNPKIPMGEKVQVKRLYDESKDTLSTFLNPIFVDEFVKLQDITMKW